MNLGGKQAFSPQHRYRLVSHTPKGTLWNVRLCSHFRETPSYTIPLQAPGSPFLLLRQWLKASPWHLRLELSPHLHGSFRKWTGLDPRSLHLHPVSLLPISLPVATRDLISFSMSLFVFELLGWPNLWINPNRLFGQPNIVDLQHYVTQHSRLIFPYFSK